MNVYGLFNKLISKIDNISLTPGPAGKSAYESAKSAGYSKEESQFNEDLSKVSEKADAAYVDDAIKKAIGDAIKASY